MRDADTKAFAGFAEHAIPALAQRAESLSASATVGWAPVTTTRVGSVPGRARGLDAMADVEDRGVRHIRRVLLSAIRETCRVSATGDTAASGVSPAQTDSTSEEWCVMAETTPVQPVEQQGEHLSLPWFCQDTHDAACGSPCTPSGCHNTHSSGRYVLDGPAWDEDYLQMGIPAMSKAHAEFIVRAANSHHALVAALKECSFRLAALVAASADFSEGNARALDMARDALACVEPTHD